MVQVCILLLLLPCCILRTLNAHANVVSDSIITENDSCSLHLGNKLTRTNSTKVLPSVFLQGGPFPSHIAIRNATEGLDIARGVVTYTDDIMKMIVYCSKLVGDMDLLEEIVFNYPRSLMATQYGCLADRTLYLMTTDSSSDVLYLLVKILLANGTEMGEMVVWMERWNVVDIALVNKSSHLDALRDRITAQPNCLYMIKVSFLLAEHEESSARGLESKMELMLAVLFIAELMVRVRDMY